MIDFFLHADQKLLEFVAAYGSWVYGLLFVIIFSETGFVVTPFLPGDSLLFAAGALAATGVLNPWFLAGLLAFAAFAGNTVNYSIGRAIGPRVFNAKHRSELSQRLLKQKHLDGAHFFFEQYGGKAVVMARFVPVVRTFVPFVAGAAQMTPALFVLYNAVGAGAWVVLCLGAGLLFGNVPIVKNNFSLVTIGIVVVSMIPMLIEYLNARQRRKRARM